MSKHLITHLRHVGIAMPDIERQLSFYRDIWDLTAVAGDTGVHFLAAEGSPEQYVVRLRKDDLKRQDLIAFGAASVADVDILAGRLIEGGVRLVHERMNRRKAGAQQRIAEDQRKPAVADLQRRHIDGNVQLARPACRFR